VCDPGSILIQRNPKGQKRRAETKREHSRQRQKPFVRNLFAAPHGSSDQQFQNAGAHCHQNDQQRDR
jgi:hypothetical protein